MSAQKASRSLPIKPGFSLVISTPISFSLSLPFHFNYIWKVYFISWECSGKFSPVDVCLAIKWLPGVLRFLPSLWSPAWHPHVSMPGDTTLTLAVIKLSGRRKKCWGVYHIGVSLSLLAVSTWPLAMPYSTHVISSLTNSLSHTEKGIIAAWFLRQS